MKRVPADWEPQQAVWFAWPHNRETWPGRFDGIPRVFRDIVRSSAEVLPVRIIGPDELRDVAGLDDSTNVHWHLMPTNDCWIRDYGPTFVVDSQDESYAIDWRYNAWGGKYPPWEDDDAATARIIKAAGWQRRRSDLTIEGGALEWDGTGRLLTSTSCLVTETRNPGRSRADIGRELRAVAGAREIVWVDGGGLDGDDTDGHIDQLARFIDSETIVVSVCDDSSDANYSGLENNFRQLREWGAQCNPRIHVHRLPIPPERRIDGRRVPESYCNYLRLGPDRMLVPSFGDSHSDSRAIGVLKELLSRRTPQTEVVAIDCRNLVWGLGALHCASCNEPAAIIRRAAGKSLT